MKKKYSASSVFVRLFSVLLALLASPSFAQNTVQVSWDLGFPFGKQTAWAYTQSCFQEDSSHWRGIYIISPGGELKAQAMSGLAEALARQGYLSFIVEHPQNLAILDTISGRGNAAVNLAEMIREEKVEGINTSNLYDLPIYLFGHSLGGATLSKAIFGKSSAVDAVVLYGVGQLITWPARSRDSGPDVVLMIGENDGLSPKGLPGFLKPLGVSFDPDRPFDENFSSIDPSIVYKRVEGLNHFCIVTDQSQGNALLKNRDGKGPAHGECLKILMKQMEELNVLP